MDPNTLIKLRLASQQLAGSAFQTGKELVEWSGAVQGQEYLQTKWGLGLRLPHLTESDLEQELRTGQIVRTHILRPTWHFVSRDDIRWLLALSAPRVHAANKYYYEKFEVNDGLVATCKKVVKTALKNKTYLTRSELQAAFEKAGIVAAGHRLSYIMMSLELDGVVINGPVRGKQFTYALLDEVVPPASKPISRSQALAELTKRYFYSRGPATIQDFSVWSGLTTAECKEGLAAVRELLAEVTLGPDTFYYRPNLQPTESTRRLYLLSTYDELLMGYKKTRTLWFANGEAPESTAFYNMMLFDGQVVGSWRIVVNGKARFEYQFFASPPQEQMMELKKEVTRLEQFLDTKVIVKE